MKAAEVKCNQLGVIDQLFQFNWGNLRNNCCQHLYNLVTFKSLVIDQLMKRINRRHVLPLRANSAIICFISIGPSGIAQSLTVEIWAERFRPLTSCNMIHWVQTSEPAY